MGTSGRLKKFSIHVVDEVHKKNEPPQNNATSTSEHWSHVLSNSWCWDTMEWCPNPRCCGSGFQTFYHHKISYFKTPRTEGVDYISSDVIDSLCSSGDTFVINEVHSINSTIRPITPGPACSTAKIREEGAARFLSPISDVGVICAL